MNNVTASPHKARLGTSTKKQGTGDFPSWQGRGLANARGQTIWWKTRPCSPFLFFTPPSPFFSLKLILFVSSESLSVQSSLSRFWSGVGDPVLHPHMLGSPALGSGTSLSFQLVQIYPRVLFPFFNASVSVLLDSPVCFWSCPLGMSSEDKIKLWVDKT